MKIKHFSLLIITLFTLTNTLAQSDTTTFKPSGKIFGLSFFDYSSGLNSSSNTSGFDITRALLGYKYQFHQNFMATIAIDGAAGRSTDDKVEVHVRNAFATWQDKGFRVDIGMMTLKQFSLQQSMWGHRYALQSQQDIADMGHAVDVGLQATYTFSPILSADISITNGEGYKTIRKDKSTKYSIGATVNPIDHFTFRLYGDIYTSDRDQFNKLGVDSRMKNQFTYSTFLAYENDFMVTGVEYNKQMNNKHIKGNSIEGFSTFSTIYFHPKWNAYARYDYYNSSNDGEYKAWYDDRQMIVAGIEFVPFSFLRFSPNFRNINYSKSSSEQYIFISGEFKF